ncbi:membrane protein insertion efficiency factor YidD [Bartonella sp. TP]|uniref:membrane protein insertion efficiency factor YidD n=1 Tax=Bartonella sp. TP TaxID=3057550 RepID=UPI0025B0B891|nr:membrane protein insertion efficiency factor YidD [Bartonella sp. TP]MDN5248763.1 membrane protein insertion efficiency factor YidD [Alphaproteobacteria bacterium]WJW80000.1 membrane protein insertion efficiency factor YidD [Bartonella sp. TP]
MISLRKCAMALIRLYQLTFSSLVGRQCRFAPSCSHFAYEAIEKFGLWRGGFLALLRLASCQPWGRSGFDPVPKTIKEYLRKITCSKQKHII